MPGYSLAIAARQDLAEIVDYHLGYSTGSARRWQVKLTGLLAAIARDPGIGHTRRDLTDRVVLFVSLGRYLIVYRVQPGDVVVLAIVYGGRDLPDFLRIRLEREK